MAISDCRSPNVEAESGARTAGPASPAYAHVGRLLKGSLCRPLQGLNSFGSFTEGGARFTSLALGCFLSGFQPFGSEPPCVGCQERFVAGSDSCSADFIGGPALTPPSKSNSIAVAALEEHMASFYSPNRARPIVTRAWRQRAVESFQQTFVSGRSGDFRSVGDAALWHRCQQVVLDIA